MSKRPEFDDLETDYFDEEVGNSFLSLMSLGVAFVCVAVFIALAWYAYQDDGDDGANDDQIAVIYPEESPVRIVPEETDDWRFPQADREIYQRREPNDIGEVEQILPQPQAPIAREILPPESSQTEGWVNTENAADAIGLTDAERQKRELANAADTADVNATIKPAIPSVAESVSITPEVQVKPEVTPPMVSVTAATPARQKQPVKEPSKEIAPKPQPVAKKKPVTPPVAVEKPVSTAAAKLTAHRLQLGAFTSRKDAQKNWQKVQQKHSSILGSKQVNIEQAVVKGKTYYRVQAYPYGSAAEAKANCVMLSGKGQACFAVAK